MPSPRPCGPCPGAGECDGLQVGSLAVRLDSGPRTRNRRIQVQFSSRLLASAGSRGPRALRGAAVPGLAHVLTGSVTGGGSSRTTERSDGPWGIVRGT